MSQRNATISPEREAEFEALEEETKDGKRRMYHLFGQPMDSEHAIFLSRRKQEKAEQEKAQRESERQTPRAVSSEEPNQKFNASQTTSRNSGKGGGAESRDVFTAIARQKEYPIQMHSPHNGWRGMKATLDTGAKENWISQEKVQALNLEEKSGAIKCYDSIYGQEFSSGTIVSPTWQPEGDHRTYESDFRVAPKKGVFFDVLLGSNLMEQGDIDFRSQKNSIAVITAMNPKPEEKREIATNATDHQNRTEKLKKTQSKSSESSSSKKKGETKKGANGSSRRTDGSASAGSKKRDP